jgi:hypothetical protein
MLIASHCHPRLPLHKGRQIIQAETWQHTNAMSRRAPQKRKTGRVNKRGPGLLKSEFKFLTGCLMAPIKAAE